MDGRESFVKIPYLPDRTKWRQGGERLGLPKVSG